MFFMVYCIFLVACLNVLTSMEFVIVILFGIV